MGVRSRSRTNAAYSAGQIRIVISGTDYGVWLYGHAGAIDHETCDDTTMPRPYTVDHSLSVVRRQSKPLKFSGDVRYSPGFPATWRLVHSNYNPPNRCGYQYCPTLPAFDSAYWQTKALANLNPTSPTWDIPLFVFELKDLPGMLRGAGTWLKRIHNDPNIRRNWRNYVGVDAASLWLALQLGWGPLVSDLLDLFGLTKSIEDRKRYLKRLESGTHVKRRLHSGVTSEYTDVTPYTYALPERVAYSAWNKHLITEDIWFTANAKLRAPLPPGEVALQTLSQDIVLGLKFEPWRVWDFLPWSWLVDYFLNVGDYIEATQALVHLEVTRLNLMATRVHSSILEPALIEAGLTASYSELKTSEKLRVPFGHPAPAFRTTPFLTGRQTSIIGALAIVLSRGKLPVGIANSS